MAFKMNFGKGRPVYLVVKDYVIRFVEIKQNDPLVVQRFYERYLPNGIVKDGKVIDETTFTLILEECVEEWKIAKRRVVFHVPDAFLIIRKITVPSNLANDEIAGHLYMELGTTIHLPFEDPVFDFTVLSTNKEQKELILFAAPEETVVTMSQLLEEVKLKPVAADVSSLSLYRIYHKILKPHQSENLLTIQADLQAVNISIFENQFPVFMRNIPIPIDHDKWRFQAMSSQNVPVTYKGDYDEVYSSLDDIYLEISRVIDFYRYTLNQGARQLDKMFVTGDHIFLDQIIKELKSRISLPIEVIETDSIRTNVDVSLRSAYQSLVGLGLKEV